MDKYTTPLTHNVKKFIEHDKPGKIQSMDAEEKKSLEILDDNGYYIADSLAEPIYEEQYKFQYKLNSEGFRSQHFKTLDKNYTNILYSGCSMTFGYGLPENYIWPTLLTSLIKEKLPIEIESFNVASPGASIHEIVRNCFIFFEKYGNPNYLFISVPDVNRSISFDSSDTKFKQIIPSKFKLRRKMSKDLIYALSHINTSNNWLLGADIMFMLELYCKSAGINLLWTSWEREQAEEWNSLKFTNYFKTEDYNVKTWYQPINGEPKPEGLKENLENLPYWGYARDGSHPGVLWSKTVSKKFIDEIEKRWFIK